MLIQFLGTGSAFTVKNFQTNILLIDENKKFLVDAGADIRWSLKEATLSYKDINGLYLSHAHNDHIGGVEYLAFTTFFDPSCKEKIQLFGNNKLLREIWNHSLKGGLESFQGRVMSMEDYFDVKMIRDNEVFQWEGLIFNIVQSVHIMNGYCIVPTYGLMITESDGRKTYYTGDTQFAPHAIKDFYSSADLIIQDCETYQFKSGVHAHYSELTSLDKDIKNKMFLVHYQDNVLNDNGTFVQEWVDKVVSDGFLGMVQKGAIIDTQQAIKRQ